MATDAASRPDLDSPGRLTGGQLSLGANVITSRPRRAELGRRQSGAKWTLSWPGPMARVLIFFVQLNLALSTWQDPSTQRRASSDSLLRAAATSNTQHYFPSSRYIYSSSQAAHLAPRAADRKWAGAKDEGGRLVAAIHGQLNALRGQLEAELGPGRPVALGSPCTSAAHCSGAIANSHCKIETFTCSCLPQHIELNSTTCLPSTLLGYGCQIDAQCQSRVENSLCEPQSQTCSCRSGFVPFRKDKCLSPSKLNDFCLTDTQCRLSDRHSFCKWRIPNVYGSCKCPPNYKLLDQTSVSANSSAASWPRCVPRLGDNCLSDDECQLSTPNSSCHESSPLVPSGRWASSNVGTRRCLCAHGFAPAQDQLRCIKLWPERENENERAGATLASLPVTDTKHHYEMLPTASTAATLSSSDKGRPEEQVDIKLMADTKPSAPPASLSTSSSLRPALASNSSIEPNDLESRRVSSLGKACSSRRECQARDPHSDCIDGLCECLRPSARCSAKAPGCPRDTFQCRNGQCISWYFVCDHFKNCDDGSDEDECRPAQCPRESFQCLSDGRCLTRAKLCNGKRDCSDGSDELQCGRMHFEGSNFTQPARLEPPRPPVATWSSSNKEESQTSRTEQKAGALEESRCRPEAFACLDGTCLPGYVFCNAVVDCPDGSDELDQVCERGPLGVASSTRAPQASASQQAASSPSESPLVKTDRAAIERLLATLALSPARTPEWRGRQRQRKAKTLQHQQQQQYSGSAECPRWAFTCANGKCRSSAILCSGVDGCGDNSDENTCEVCQCEPALFEGAGSASAPPVKPQQRLKARHQLRERTGR